MYKKLMKREVTEEQQFRFGRWSGAIVLLASIWIAISFTNTTTTLFEKIQTVFFYIAPPFAVIFTLGILWRRANAVAAGGTNILRFVFTSALSGIEGVGRVNTYNHRALCAWGFCLAVVGVSASLAA